jgi:hypothetical protein
VRKKRQQASLVNLSSKNIICYMTNAVANQETKKNKQNKKKLATRGQSKKGKITKKIKTKKN